MLEKIRKKIARPIKALFPGNPILLYHRVAENASDPQMLCVSPKHFSEHLAVLRKSYDAISIDELVSGKNRSSDKICFAISFDDGYTDNYQNAKPLLEQFEVPATVFITGASIGSSVEFWWDELERIILQPGNLPEQFDLSIAGDKFHWDSSGGEQYSQKDFDQFHGWTMLETKDYHPRTALYRELCRLLHPLPADECQKTLHELKKLAKILPAERSTHRTMSADEIILLTSSGVIKAGAHTMTHPALVNLLPQLQKDEMKKNKLLLEEIVGRKVTGFSYPFGTKADYGRDSIKMAKEVGFNYACANFPGQVRWWTDPFELPRFLVHDWDGDEFARQIRSFLQI